MGFKFSLRKRHEPEDIMPEPASIEGSVEAAGAAASGADVLGSLKQFEQQHHLDPNLPIDELNDVDAALNSGNVEKGLAVEQVIIEDNSPYPEVRASVRNYDVDMPANTIRAWTIGLILCTVGSGVNMLFSLRNPSVTVTTYVIQLVAYPIGLLWDLVFPDREFNVFGLKFNFKPGPFNFKEHVIIVVMSNVSGLRCHPCFLSRPPSNTLRLPTVAVLCTRRMSSSPSRCGTSSTLAGDGRSSLASPRSARATVLPVCRAASSCGRRP